jgi:pilus assembly protein FimV
MGLAVCGGAWALSLGRITLQSTRGEALRAEIELSALSAEEAASLSARIASPEAFSRAGVAYSPALAGAQVSVQQRADGRTVLRIRSDAPVQESFLDLILQIEWASGHLTREYTLLFEASQPAAEAPASAAAPVLGAAPAAPAPASGKVTPAPADRYTVRRGDTLSGVAVRMQAQGVSLDQLLVALFRSNPHAFVGQNMNRLRADAVLRLPAPEQARQIARGEARQVVRMQSADFNEYRMRLAGLAPAARVEESARRSGGAVEAAVEDRRTARPAPDRLKLSRTPGASSEAALAREAERREQSQRVAELSRNVDELKRLATNSPAPASAVVGKGPAPAAEAASEAASAPGASAPAAVTAPASAAQAVAAASTASAPEATATAAAPPPAAVAPQVQSTGFMGFLERSWALLLGGGVALLALLGAGFLLWRRRKQPHAETSFLESRLQPESFFGGSPAADAPAAASAAVASDPYSMSQLDAIGDVDPVAEADVYLAYGRDLQAEEILKEALRGHPQRLGIRTKLLEVYAKRHDVKAFEQLAQQVHQITQGQGEDWAKVRDLGLQIDPDNALYAGAQAPASVVSATWRPTEPPPGAAEGLDLDLEQLESVPPVLHEEDFQPPAAEPEPTLAMQTPAEPQEQLEPEIDLGFDIEPEAEPQPELALDELSLADEEPVQERPKTADVASMAAQEAAVVATSAQDAKAAEDDLPLLPEEAGLSSTLDEDALPELDFGLSDLPDEPLPTRAPQPPAASPSLPFDLDSLSLDLDEPSTPAVLDELNISGFGEETDPLERKLELADEFRQIGDADGARDLLQEVLAQASGPLKARAQGMLDSLV